VKLRRLSPAYARPGPALAVVTLTLAGLVGCSTLTGPDVITLFVAPELVDCVGVGPRTCMQVRESPEESWELFYSGIEGFEFEPGFFYELRVEIHHVLDPPADGSSLRYVLDRIVEKKAASGGASMADLESRELTTRRRLPGRRDPLGAPEASPVS